MTDLRLHINEEEILQEDFKQVRDRAVSVANKLKDKIQKILDGLQYEKTESRKMMYTFFMSLKEMFKDKKTVTDEEMNQAMNQLLQVGKLAAIAPLFIMPGGGTTTTILYFLGKKMFNISILPKGLESVFESIEDLRTVNNNLLILETLYKD